MILLSKAATTNSPICLLLSPEINRNEAEEEEDDEEPATAALATLATHATPATLATTSDATLANEKETKVGHEMAPKQEIEDVDEEEEEDPVILPEQLVKLTNPPTPQPFLSHQNPTFSCQLQLAKCLIYAFELL